ncbi:hypothetical protein E2562_013453 [Oryza meyeriana var. granulata]|uniref:Uncharacterized protein n=1 Tax=Oryza meyeriana var. granulata TaxID=110450 RepID=A0A6G1BWJ6_9ORYZ|nr:hypothetical protein E2562_013453 [Oryza meyeriana var. granulata]
MVVGLVPGRIPRARLPDRRRDCRKPLPLSYTEAMVVDLALDSDLKLNHPGQRRDCRGPPSSSSPAALVIDITVTGHGRHP